MIKSSMTGRAPLGVACTLLAVATGLVLSQGAGLALAAWEPEEKVVDFGIRLSEGEREIVVDALEVGHRIDADLLWQVDPQACLVQALIREDTSGGTHWVDIQDDGMFDGHPAHARVAMAEGISVTTRQGRQCDVGSRVGDFLTISTMSGETPGTTATHRAGATVLLLRATAFYTPREVRIKAGEKVVWFYADGSRGPHTVTSGACREADCSGGGQSFASGPTLLKPGDRFEHTFTKPGTFPYHCDFHTATMQATVIVSP